MKNCMQDMTLDDIRGHWKSIDGRCYLVIDEDKSKVQLFVNHDLYLDEQLFFEYLQVDNHCRISESIILWMIFPLEESVILKINDAPVEFTRKI